MTYLDRLKEATNYTFTENGALTHKSTLSGLYDLFSLGGAYRSRTEEECITLFLKAYAEDPVYALKCLFYLRDARGGQGERRFFRVVFKYLACNDFERVRGLVKYIPEFGRWDDLFALKGTALYFEALELIKQQLALDMECRTPSLLAKWLPSENASSPATISHGNDVRRYLNMTHKQYRKTLSILRDRINVVEKLMSSNQWDKIEFDKIPSKAGLIYKNAFARRDIIKAKYEAFAKDENTKVNAGTLYPYEVVHKALEGFSWRGEWIHTDTDRAIVNKYWANLTDYFDGATLNALAVVDTSGSMTSSYNNSNIRPIDVAISLGLYCADKAQGPFHNHYISFASRPQLIDTTAPDFCQAVYDVYKTNLVDNTNLEAVFDLLLNTAVRNNMKQEELPNSIIIISDMEIDDAQRHRWDEPSLNVETQMEGLRKEWAARGYRLPNLIYWNVNARHDNILDLGPNVSCVSGCSPVIFKQVLTGKTGFDLMMDKLNEDRYSCIC